MAATGRGHGTYIGLGEETTYGTEQTTVNNWMRVLSQDLNRAPDIQEKKHLGVNGATNTVARETYPAAVNVGGPIEMYASYDDSTLLALIYAFGDVTTTGTAAPYSHTYDLTVPRSSSYKGLTIRVGRGEVDQWTHLGCLVSKFTFKVAAGEPAKLNIELIGQDTKQATPESQTTPTYNTSNECIRADHMGTLDWNSLSWKPSDLEITVDKKLARRPVLGSLNTEEPTLDGMAEVTVKSTIYLGETVGIETGLHAYTQSNLTATFTGTGSNSLAITVHNAQIMSASAPINTAGQLKQTVTWKGLADASNAAVQFLMQNANASATTN